MTATHTDPTTAPHSDLVNLVETAQQALAAGDLDTAREAYTAMTTSFPDEAVAHNNLGAFEMGVSNYAGAEAAFSSAAALMRGHANCLFNLALAQYRQEKLSDAAQNFALAHAADPQDAETLNNLGACRYQIGEQDQARRDVENALKLQPNYPSAVMNLSDMEFLAGRTDKAIAICQAYLDHNQDLGVTRQLLTILDAAQSRANEVVDMADTTARAAAHANDMAGAAAE